MSSSMLGKYEVIDKSPIKPAIVDQNIENYFNNIIHQQDLDPNSFNNWRYYFTRPFVCFMQCVPHYGKSVTIYGVTIEKSKEDEDTPCIMARFYSRYCIEGEIGILKPYTIPIIIPEETFDLNHRYSWPDKLRLRYMGDWENFILRMNDNGTIQ